MSTSLVPTQEKGVVIHQSHQRCNRPRGRIERVENDANQALTTRGCIPSKTTTATTKRHAHNGTPQPFTGLVEAGEPVCIMMMAPDPHDEVRLAVREEYNAIDAELRALKSHKWCLDRVLRCRVSEITEQLNKFQPNILHIGSHGGEGVICFEGDNGECLEVNKVALAELLATQPGLKLVVLNSCFSDQQAQYMAEAVGNVIGMTGTIDDGDAVAFSREFFAHVARGCDLTGLCGGLDSRST